MKRIVSVVLAVIMVMAMSSTVFAAGISSSKAERIALKNAKLSKSQVAWLEVDYDDGAYEVEFVRKSNRAEYSYEISASSGKIWERSVDYAYKRNSSRKKVGKTAAMKAAAKKAGVKLSVVKSGFCHYEYDDGEGKYEIVFKKGNKRYDIDVLAPTGKVIDYDWEVITIY